MKFDSSYDRAKAKRLAEDLQRRFRQSEMEGPAPMDPRMSLPSSPVPDRHIDDPNVYRQDVLNDLLDWSLTTKGMARAFLADTRGLVVAERGEAGDWHMDRLACQLSEGFEVLARCREEGTPPDILVWRSGDWWLGAAHLLLAGEPLVLGLVSEEMISPPALTHLRDLMITRLRG